MTEPTLDPTVDYPLSLNRQDLLFTPNGKPIADITMEAVMSGDVTASDLRITPQTLRLQAQIDRLTEDLDSSALDEMQAELDKLKGPGGLEAVEGPGVTITLDDAPRQVLDDGSGDISVKIVHQQDIQAVVNAMWAGGAEAVTVQGQRITSSTGIKCVGNSVLLQGVAYPPPYVISAIGDARNIVSRVDQDPAVQLYLHDVDTYQLGWDLDLAEELTFPAYDGPIDTEYARPATPTDAGS